VAQVTAKDILLAVIIPLALAEIGPWCGWLAVKLLPWAAKLRYKDTERAAVRLEEWTGDVGDIPGQLTKLAYALGQLAAGSAVYARRKVRAIPPKAMPANQSVDVDDAPTALQRGAVLEALSSLPTWQKRVITLRAQEDLTLGEIAIRTGMSNLAVRSHYAKGMAALRLALEHPDQARLRA
jgi:hypothetical protein